MHSQTRSLLSVRPGCGISVLVTRSGDEILMTNRDGEVLPIPDALRAELERLPESFEIEGFLTAYRNWTLQPTETLEGFLESGEDENERGLRTVLVLESLTRLENETFDTDSAGAAATLHNRFPDSLHIRKDPPWEEMPVLDSETLRGSGIAPDILFSSGVLDFSDLTRLLKEAEVRRDKAEERARTLEQRLRLEAREAERLEPILELGRERLEEIRRQAAGRLRAIRLHVGNTPQDAQCLARLEDPATDPALIREIHGTLSARFAAIYPNGPIGSGTPEPAPIRKSELGGYRMDRE